MRPRAVFSQGQYLACKACGPSLTIRGSGKVQWRRYSTPAPAAGVLPLEGIRVLDMTRVLAGVSKRYLTMQTSGLSSRDKPVLKDLQPYCTQILGDLG